MEEMMSSIEREKDPVLGREWLSSCSKRETTVIRCYAEFLETKDAFLKPDGPCTRWWLYERRTCGVHARMILSPVVIYKLLLGKLCFFWYYVLDHMLGTPSF